jgi:TPP-dependent pyruvate/acetoin dehydrogenase alpha subunit
VERIHQEVHAEVDECIKFAEESPAPPPDELYANVYA